MTEKNLEAEERLMILVNQSIIMMVLWEASPEPIQQRLGDHVEFLNSYITIRQKELRDAQTQ